MTISLSSAGEDLLLAQTFQRQSTWPSVGYLALFTTLPGKDDGGVECTGSGYTRVVINFDINTWGGPVAGALTNANDISFGTPTADDWGEIVGFAFMFDLTTDLQLSAGLPLAVAKTPTVGTPVVFSAGTLVISAVETA